LIDRGLAQARLFARNGFANLLPRPSGFLARQEALAFAVLRFRSGLPVRVRRAASTPQRGRMGQT
jgi:hypothetical protein